MHLQLITPEGTTVDEMVDSVTLPTGEGEITVLPGHIPIVSVLKAGTVMIKRGGKVDFFAVSKGVVEVSATGVRILADSADRAADLEEQAIEKAKESAEKLKSERRHDAEGFAEAVAILDRELARLRTVRRHRSHHGVIRKES
jgi:F-type H+-transporting ATPase subunit epsilon